METKYYKAKNSFSPVSFIVILVATFILGSVLSWPYLWLEEKIPFIYLNILIPVGTGIILGFVIGKIARILKKHSPIFGILSIFIGYLGMTIIKWALYVYNLVFVDSGTSFFEGMKLILTSPAEFWETIGYINTLGTWGFSESGNVTGALLWIVWIGEFILLFVCFVAMFYNQIDIPFIDKDNNWAVKYGTKFEFTYFNVADVSRTIENDPNTLFLYPRLQRSGAKVNYVSAELYRSQDGGLNYLTLSTHILDDKGNYSATKVIKHLIVDWDFVNNLINNTYTGPEEQVSESI